CILCSSFIFLCPLSTYIYSLSLHDALPIYPAVVEFSVVTFAVLIISIGIKLWMAAFFGSLSKRIHSTTLQATSMDSRNDVIASSDRKSTRLNSSHVSISYAVFCLKKKIHPD